DYLPDDVRADNELALAELYLGPLDRPEAALDAILRALELLRGDARAIAMLEKLVTLSATRARAAQALEREFAAVGDASRQAAALKTVIETTEDREARIDLYLELASLYEDRLAAPDKAFDIVLRALTEAQAHLPLWDRAAELAESANRLTDRAAAYRVVLNPSSEFSEELEAELCDR